MKSRVQHLSKIRGTVVAATVGVVAATLTVGVVAWPAAGGSGSAEGTAAAVTRVDPLPSGASVTRSGKPAGHALQQLKERQRKQAARLAREARQRKARAARSASRTVDYDSNPRGIAQAMMSERYGWGAGEFSCLSALWERESSWDVHASNATSGAYGIPQALPGGKMSAYGPDWESNPVTQIQWGLAYIRDSYGTPCGAWSAFQSKGWY